MRDLGYVEGENLVIEFRWSGTVEQMHAAAAPRTRVSYESTIFDVSVTCPRIARLERFLTRARRA